MTELMASIHKLDHSGGMHAEHVLSDLANIFTTQPPDKVTAYRRQIEKLASSGKLSVTRQLAYVAMMSTDKSADKAWQQAMNSVGSLRDFVEAVPLVSNAKLRASLHGKIEPLLHGLPSPLAERAKKLKGQSERTCSACMPPE